MIGILIFIYCTLFTLGYKGANSNPLNLRIVHKRQEFNKIKDRFTQFNGTAILKNIKMKEVMRTLLIAVTCIILFSCSAGEDDDLSPMGSYRLSRKEEKITSDIWTENSSSEDKDGFSNKPINTRSIGSISNNPDANGVYTWTGNITKKIAKHQKVWLSGDASRTGAKGVFVCDVVYYEAYIYDSQHRYSGVIDDEECGFYGGTANNGTPRQGTACNEDLVNNRMVLLTKFYYIICDAGGEKNKRWIPFNPNTKTPKLKYKKL